MHCFDVLEGFIVLLGVRVDLRVYTFRYKKMVLSPIELVGYYRDFHAFLNLYFFFFSFGLGTVLTVTVTGHFLTSFLKIIYYYFYSAKNGVEQLFFNCEPFGELPFAIAETTFSLFLTVGDYSMDLNGRVNIK